MAEMRCPRDDRTRGNPKDVTEVACPACGAEIEFWAGEDKRTCRACGAEVSPPTPETE